MTTEFLTLAGGRIAYEVAGAGPLVVLSHGMGDRRQAYRHLAPLLVDAGYRVAAPDLRGHGESSAEWTSHDGSVAISRTDVAGDLLALVRHLGGGPAVLVGHSLSGGAVTIAAAQAPDLVAGVIEINPFTRKQKVDIRALLTNARHRRGMARLTKMMLFRSLRQWLRYLDVAYPRRPADHAQEMAALADALRRPGRMAEYAKTWKSTPADADAKLSSVRCPALIVMGTLDPDFPDPAAEGAAVAARMPAGQARVALCEGCGHYPHAEDAERVAQLATAFLAEVFTVAAR